MRPVNRYPVNKGSSTRKFNHKAKRTAAANVGRGLARGGWRL